MSTDIEIVEDKNLQESNLGDTSSDLTLVETRPLAPFKGIVASEFLEELDSIWVNKKFMAKKAYQLMNAQTINNNGDVMDDNKVQLETWKAVMKLQRNEKLWDGPQIAIFNNIPNNGPLQY